MRHTPQWEKALPFGPPHLFQHLVDDWLQVGVREHHQLGELVLGHGGRRLGPHHQVQLVVPSPAHALAGEHGRVKVALHPLLRMRTERRPQATWLCTGQQHRRVKVALHRSLRCARAHTRSHTETAQMTRRNIHRYDLLTHTQPDGDSTAVSKAALHRSLRQAHSASGAHMQQQWGRKGGQAHAPPDCSAPARRRASREAARRRRAACARLSHLPAAVCLGPHVHSEEGLQAHVLVDVLLRHAVQPGVALETPVGLGACRSTRAHTRKRSGQLAQAPTARSARPFCFHDIGSEWGPAARSQVCVSLGLEAERDPAASGGRERGAHATTMAGVLLTADPCCLATAVNRPVMRAAHPPTAGATRTWKRSCQHVLLLLAASCGACSPSPGSDTTSPWPTTRNIIITTLRAREQRGARDATPRRHTQQSPRQQRRARAHVRRRCRPQHEPAPARVRRTVSPPGRGCGAAKRPTALCAAAWLVRVTPLWKRRTSSGRSCAPVPGSPSGCTAARAGRWWPRPGRGTSAPALSHPARTCTQRSLPLSPRPAPPSRAASLLAGPRALLRGLRASVAMPGSDAATAGVRQEEASSVAQRRRLPWRRWLSCARRV